MIFYVEYYDFDNLKTITKSYKYFRCALNCANNHRYEFKRLRCNNVTIYTGVSFNDNSIYNGNTCDFGITYCNFKEDKI